MAYRSFGRFRQASTRLDTPPFSHRHHPVSAIAREKVETVATPDKVAGVNAEVAAKLEKMRGEEREKHAAE
jgi:hypothetical protein